MAQARLALKEKRSARQSERMIVELGLWGRHGYRSHLTSADDVFALLRHYGYDREELIEDCRTYPRAVPMFENLIPATGHLGSGGVERLRDPVSGETIYEFEGPGVTASPGYQGLFEYAYSARDKAAEETALPEYQAAIVFGFASIEALLNRFALLWNHRNPDKAVTEGKDHRVSIEDKFDDWVPTFTGGKTFDKGGVEWNDFKQLKNERDDAVHPKLGRIAVSYSDMADYLNRFKTGVAGVLFELLKLVDWGVPSKIIKARHAPEVQVVSKDDGAG